jgi:hypothetical protein
MKQNFQLIKPLYSKNSYQKVIDTSFTQLGVISTQQQIENKPTVEDFFQLYNELFYEIPEISDNNSHEYLIKTSSEYIGFNANQEEIEALQAEIAQLRVDLLDAQKQLIESQTGTTLANPT